MLKTPTDMDETTRAAFRAYREQGYPAVNSLRMARCEANQDEMIHSQWGDGSNRQAAQKAIAAARDAMAKARG